jgi:hypothetical protein
LREENQQLQRQTPIGQNQAVELSPEDQFILHKEHMLWAMRQLGLAMRIYAGDNNEQYATNFDQLKNELGGVTNFAGNIGLDSVEFVNVGLVNVSMPDKIIFRERVPYQDPGAGSVRWVREYVLSDGSVQTQYSDDGNFDNYEKQHMVSSPNQ